MDSEKKSENLDSSVEGSANCDQSRSRSISRSSSSSGSSSSDSSGSSSSSASNKNETIDIKGFNKLLKKINNQIIRVDKKINEVTDDEAKTSAKINKELDTIKRDLIKLNESISGENRIRIVEQLKADSELKTVLEQIRLRSCGIFNILSRMLEDIKILRFHAEKKQADGSPFIDAVKATAEKMTKKKNTVKKPVKITPSLTMSFSDPKAIEKSSLNQNNIRIKSDIKIPSELAIQQEVLEKLHAVGQQQRLKVESTNANTKNIIQKAFEYAQGHEQQAQQKQQEQQEELKKSTGDSFEEAIDLTDELRELMGQKGIVEKAEEEEKNTSSVKAEAEAEAEAGEEDGKKKRKMKRELTEEKEKRKHKKQKKDKKNKE